jgi:uncharacterized phiE125 gp8 family phage protein
MAQTNLIDVIRVKTGAEVVDTAFVKRYLSISTDTHDALLNDLIIAAREEIEKASCLSLVLQTVTAEWSAAYGDTRLPYPKIIAITSAKDNDNNILTLNTGYTLKGQDKKIITGDFQNGLVLVYTAGYGVNTPTDLKLAIAKHVSENFEVRTGISLSGAGMKLLPNNWRTTAAMYRPSWIF